MTLHHSDGFITMENPFLNSQMNPLETLIEAIKNDIFIFRLGGLTRTATVSYYSTQDGGLALLNGFEVLHCENQISTSLRDNNVCFCVLLIKKITDFRITHKKL